MPRAQAKLRVNIVAGPFVSADISTAIFSPVEASSASRRVISRSRNPVESYYERLVDPPPTTFAVGVLFRSEPVAVHRNDSEKRLALISRSSFSHGVPLAIRTLAICPSIRAVVDSRAPRRLAVGRTTFPLPILRFYERKTGGGDGDRAYRSSRVLPTHVHKTSSAASRFQPREKRRARSV